MRSNSNTIIRMTIIIPLITTINNRNRIIEEMRIAEIKKYCKQLMTI